MNLSLRLRSALIALALLVHGTGGGVPTAQAYVPPSQFIVKQLAAKHSGIKMIRIKSQVTLIEAGAPSQTRFTLLTFYDFAGQTLRSWALGDGEQKVYRLERKGAALSALDSLLFSPNTAELTRNLKEEGLPIRTEAELLALGSEEERRATEETSLKRWKGAPAWVLGKAEPEAPQLWIEKDSFLPLRFIGKGSAPEVQLESYRTQHGFPYPRSITYLKPGEPVLREDVLELVVGPSFPEMRQAAAADGFQENAGSLPSEVRALMERYFATR